MSSLYYVGSEKGIRDGNLGNGNSSGEKLPPWKNKPIPFTSRVEIQVFMVARDVS